MSTFSVSAIIEKSENRDKDLRHMALYDLHTELQKENVKLDETSQRQLADVVLRLLDDSSSDVQGMAVKCLGPLVTKMSKFQVENSVAKLSTNILKGDDEKRDIATIALKTVISKLPIVTAIGPVRKALPLLIKALEGDVPEVKLDSLEVLNDISRRFGNVIQNSHQILQEAFLNELSNKRPAVRKRAITALSLLSVHTSDKLFSALVSNIIFGIKTASKEGGTELRTYIQCTSQIAKTCGQRLGKRIDEFIDLLLKAAEDISELEEENEGENDEVREYIMQALESFVLKCQTEITMHVELITILCNEYIEYDPNFSYEESDDEIEGDEMDTGDEEEDGEFGGGEDEDDDGNYSDDADITWKVRKAAAKCLLAIIKTKPDQIELLYKYTCLPGDEENPPHPLVSRFKEREESVKLVIFKVFQALLHQTVTQTTTSKGEQIVTQHPQIKYIISIKKPIIARTIKQLKNRSPRVKLAAIQVLGDLCFTLQGGLEEYIKPLVSNAKAVLETDEQHTALKMATLQFLQELLKYHKPEMFKGVFDDLANCIYGRINDKYYKVTSEAIKSCGILVKVIKDINDEGKIKQLYNQIFEKLKIQDIDQDVKENAIKSMGIVLANFGKVLKKEMKTVLNIFLNRLKNETTRLVTCKSIGDIAEQQVDISQIIDNVVSELSSFLRKQDRPLRQSALVTLTIISKTYKKKITQQVVEELSKLVSDQDLHLAHLALNLSNEILKNNKECVGLIESSVLPKILDLLGNSTLQGAALQSSLNVLIGLTPKMGYKKMLQIVLSSMKGEDISKQIYLNIAKAVSALISTGSKKDKEETISKFQAKLQKEKSIDRLLALFTIGEIGRTVDLSKNEKIIKLIQDNFDSSSEEIKNAASYALGNVSIGNLEHFFPQILESITIQSKKKYLLIHALKEIIVRSEKDDLEKYNEKLIPLLFENSGSKEEGVRNVVSECLGKLCLVFYDTMMPKIMDHVKNAKSNKSKAVCVSAVKYIITEKPIPIDIKLKSDLKMFFKLLDKKKEKINVRRAVILLLTSVAHNKPSIIKEYLGRFLPNLYVETEFDPAFERTINLGPFKYTVDDGLELRKSAFECLDTILTTMRENINPIQFVKCLVNGFSDKNNDIKLLTRIITIKCANFYPKELLMEIEKCCPHISKVLKRKIRDSALQQEKERHEELVRSTLKVVYAFSKINGASDIVKLGEIIEKIIQTTPKLKNYYSLLKGETEVGEVELEKK